MCSVTWNSAVRLVFCGSSEVGSACAPTLRVPPDLGAAAEVAAGAAAAGVCGGAAAVVGAGAGAGAVGATGAQAVSTSAAVRKNRGKSRMVVGPPSFAEPQATTPGWSFGAACAPPQRGAVQFRARYGPRAGRRQPRPRIAHDRRRSTGRVPAAFPPGPRLP